MSTQSIEHLSGGAGGEARVSRPAGAVDGVGLHEAIKKYAYQARLEDVRAHTPRHTFAKNLVDAETPMDQVATLLGHESLVTTRVYSRPSERDLEEAVRRASEEIFGKWINLPRISCQA
jgi:site-specific recombinase XerD